MTPSGMINNVSEYQFVEGDDIDSSHPHGDLDRIVINGGIMPLRDETLNPSNPTNWKKCLRGEDIAFLMEGVKERSYLADKRNALKSTFTSEIGYQQINSIISQMKGLYGEYYSSFRYSWFLKPNADLSSLTPAAWDSDVDFHDVYPDIYYNLSDCDSRNTTVSRGSALSQSVISTLFGDMNRLQRELYGILEPTVIGSPWGNLIFRNSDDGAQYCIDINFTPLHLGSRGSIENYVVGQFSVLALDPFYDNTMWIPVDRTETVRNIVQRVMSVLGLSGYTSPGRYVSLSCGEVYMSLVTDNRTRWT